MGAVRKMLIPLATRLGVSDPKQSVHDFFQQMQEEVRVRVRVRARFLPADAGRG
jgi:hypothetical protein